MKRTATIKKTNPARKKKAHAAAFGPPGFVEFVHAYGCVVDREYSPRYQGCEGPIEAAHVRGRKDGWRDNVVGLCRGHHTAAPGSFHHMGSAAAFEERWGIDLDLWACAIRHQFEINGGAE